MAGDVLRGILRADDGKPDTLAAGLRRPSTQEEEDTVVSAQSLVPVHVRVGILAVALLTAIAPASASTPHAATMSVPKCATAALVVWLDTQGDGAAGSVYYKLRLTNLSGHRCTLRGYPGVSAVDLAGRRLGTAAVRNPHVPTRAVTLAPAQTAHAALQITDIDVFAKTSCRPRTAAGLRVYPPSQKESKVVPFPFRACSRSGLTYLHVDAVTGPA